MYIYDKRQRVIEKTNKQTKIIIMGVEGVQENKQTIRRVRSVQIEKIIRHLLFLCM